MSDHDHADCAEFTTSRRTVLRGLAATAGAAVMTSVDGSLFRQVSFAAAPSADSVLVVLSMRGGADGLSLVVPHGDPAYLKARPKIGVPRSALFGQDAMFGLHPALRPLEPMWKSGELAAVHATGLRVPNRSHFEAMELVEDADPGSSARVGWINRMIGQASSGTPVQGMQLGSAITPSQLYGPTPTLSVRDLKAVSFPVSSKSDLYKGKLAAMSTNWGNQKNPLGRAVQTTREAVREFATVDGGQPANNAKYPTGELGRALADTAKMVRADIGAEVVCVDYGSWDMHANLGTLDWGSMKSMAGEFASAVAAFFTDLGPLKKKVTLVTISEFGRRVAENANAGLDHGYGNVMFVAGAGVKGGSYYGTWPGLGDSKRVDGDLAVTTDYRSVLAEVLSTRFNRSATQVFPGLSPERVGMMVGA